MTTQNDAAASARKRPIRTIADVEEADPLALAMMTRAQVDALGQAAAKLRVHRMLNAGDTMLGLPELMAWLNVGRSAVAKWRWRQNAGDEVDGRRTVLPKPDPGQRRSANGQLGPHWSLKRLLPWAAEHEKVDRHDYVPFEKIRNRGGKKPAVVRAELGVAPSQRRRRMPKEQEQQGDPVAA